VLFTDTIETEIGYISSNYIWFLGPSSREVRFRFKCPTFIFPNFRNEYHFACKILLLHVWQ